MENSKILGFQFAPTKVLQPDPSSGKSWETCSSADSEPSTTSQINNEWLNVYLLPILQIFFTKLIKKHAIINLFLIHNTKRFKVFFPYISYTIFSKPVSLLHIAYYKKLIYKKLGLRWFRTQEAPRAAITFLTKF